MNSEFIRLNTSSGVAIFRKSDIQAVADGPTIGREHLSVKSRLWVRGHDDPFNIVETADAILAMLSSDHGKEPAK